MIRRFLLAVALVWAASVPALADQPPEEISEAALMRHIAVLAGDEMKGRKPGSRAGEKAPRYIARELKGAGLEPAAPGGGWFQTVDLIERRAVSNGSSFAGERGGVAIAPDDVVLIGRTGKQRIRDAPIVYGVHGYDAEIAGLDLRGAIVLIRSDDPPGTRLQPSFDERRASMARRGALAVLTMQPKEAKLKAIRSAYASGRTQLASDTVPLMYGAIAYPAWSRLFAAAGTTPDGRTISLPVRADLQATTAIRRYRSVNVIGKLPGATQPDEALLFTAHWDHLGICRPPMVRDRICNGAVDNASGVAVLIETARALAQGPRPQRSVLFVATTAEELGLLGARAFVAQPPVPLSTIVANLNLDTVALAGRGAAVGVIGRGMTPLDPLIDAAAAGLGRRVEGSTEGNVFISRQDGWVLMKAGVPSVMLGGAFSDRALLNAYFASRYHAPSDDLSHGLQLGGAAEDAALHVALGRILTDPKRFPARSR